MFKLLWSNPSPPKGREEAGQPVPSGDQLKMLAEHFPIGRKVRYFPEYQRDIVFHTIVIAWRVNDQDLYARESILRDAEGAPQAFLVGERKARLPLERVKRLQLMVPDTTDMERSLDYIRRASLGRNGQFVRGNAITLIAATCRQGIPSVDTQVDSRILMKSGPFADNQMVLLSPDFETLAIADQRKKARVPGRIPARLYLKEDAPAVACLLGDFSDVSLRLVPAPGQALPMLKPNDKVTVVLDLGDVASSYRLRGGVFRSAPEACVIRLRQLYKDGDYDALKTMDVLEIKTGLLNLPG